VTKGLKVPCLFMITEVSTRCQKTLEVSICRIPAYTLQYTTAHFPRCYKILAAPLVSRLSQCAGPAGDMAVADVDRVVFEPCLMSVCAQYFSRPAAVGATDPSDSWAIRATLLRVIADRRIATSSRPCSIFFSCPAVNSTGNCW